jgi:ABC-type spermidine/putrescine transport system permease subunit II
VRRPSLSGAWTAMVLLFLYAPIVIVLVNAFNAERSLIGWGGFTFDWFETAFSNDETVTALWVSVKIAVISTVLSLVLAVTAGLWARRASPRWLATLDATTYMRIVLPEIVIAVGLFVLFRRLDIGFGLATVVVGHVVFNSAFATVIIQARLASLTSTLEEAAADLGARPYRVFQRVTLPLLMPAILVAGLLAFTFSFDNVITSSFLAGDTAPLPVRILGLIRFRLTPEVNAIAAGVMLITLVSFVLAVAAVGLRGAGTTLMGVRLGRGRR